MQSHRLPGPDEAEEGVRDEQMSLREGGDSRVRSGRSERDRAMRHHMSAFYVKLPRSRTLGLPPEVSTSTPSFRQGNEVLSESEAGLRLSLWSSRGTGHSPRDTPYLQLAG